MEEALELARSNDTKKRRAGVDRLQQLLEDSRKCLSSSEVTALVDTCVELLKDTDSRVSEGALLLLSSAAELFKLHSDRIMTAVVDRLWDGEQRVRDSARRLLITLMEGEVPTVVGSSSGIICLYITSSPSRYILLNPLTKHYKEVGAPYIFVPDCEQASVTSGFFYDEWTDDLKIVQLLRWDQRLTSLDAPGPKKIHALRVCSVNSANWEVVDLGPMKVSDRLGGVLFLPKALVTFVDAFATEPEINFWLDFRDCRLKAVPELEGAELSMKSVWWNNQVGVIVGTDSIYVLDEEFAAWYYCTVLPDVGNCVFCLDENKIVGMGAGESGSVNDYNILNSTSGEIQHIISLPSCRVFPYVPTFYYIEGMANF
uniref:Uncharacterized protein n=1 Tax=Daucus carota subsp. sativus TaxID=79200 RepID=A0A162A795_DAUCS